MKFVDEFKYNNETIMLQEKKHSSLLIITFNEDTNEYTLWKHGRKSLVLKDRDIHKIQKRMERYK